jgi:hypothetical protein
MPKRTTNDGVGIWVGSRSTNFSISVLRVYITDVNAGSLHSHNVTATVIGQDRPIFEP